jgi:cullin-associated NEDD8-dissociated protein 1
MRDNQLEFTIDKLIEYSGGKDDELRDISGLGAPSTFFKTSY